MSIKRVLNDVERASSADASGTHECHNRRFVSNSGHAAHVQRVRAQRARAVQRRASDGAAQSDGQVHEAAQQGVQGAATTLPHLDSIQASFGKHDVSGVAAHVGGYAKTASDSIGAEAYALGTHVAFGGQPNLHTAAHEAAHVVQQRGGVQLSGGVGQSGDRYEQHADQVADQVVAGQSAEETLDEFVANDDRSRVDRNDELAGGESASGHAVQRDTKGDATADNATASGDTENDKFEADLDKIENAYADLCKDQLDAVDDLKVDAEKSDPPGLVASLVMVGVEVALAGAIGGLAKYVELEAYSGKENTGKILAKVISDGFKQLAKTEAKHVVGTLENDPKVTSTEMFWRSQRDGLDAVMRGARDLFIDQKASLRRSADGPKEAAAMLRGLKKAIAEAPRVQTMYSLDEWCNYMAKTSLGDRGMRGQLEEGGLESTVGGGNKGVLSLVISVSEPGAVPTVGSGWISGLNRGLRKEIENRPLKDINIAKTIKARLYGTTYMKILGHEVGAEIEFGVEPDGTMTWVSMSAAAQHWLDFRAEIAGGGDGMELLIEDMGDLSVKGLKAGDILG